MKRTIKAELWNDDRAVVMAALHHKGELANLLSDREWVRFYLACDGFGRGLTRRQAEDQCWDWSHVRDSSQEILAVVAPVVRHTLI